jgi:hypothetical protein
MTIYQVRQWLEDHGFFAEIDEDPEIQPKFVFATKEYPDQRENKTLIIEPRGEKWVVRITGPYLLGDSSFLFYVNSLDEAIEVIEHLFTERLDLDDLPMDIVKGLSMLRAAGLSPELRPCTESGMIA